MIHRPPQSREEYRAELRTVVHELLTNKVPKEERYAELDAQVNAIMETAHSTGFLDEAGDLAMRPHKKRRFSSTSEARTHVANGNPRHPAPDSPWIGRTEIPPGVSLNSTAREPLAARSVSRPFPFPSQGGSNENSWSSEPYGSLTSEVTSSYALHAPNTASFGGVAEEDNLFESWYDVPQESIPALEPSDERTEVEAINPEGQQPQSVMKPNWDQ
jgi:hypothetical protein